MNKILIRGADTVGSFVLATPFYRELRKNFPKAYIVLCIKPLVYELAKGCPYVNKVIVYNSKSLVQKIKFIKELRKESFDTVFLISGSIDSAFISFLAGIRNRVGYSHDYRSFLLTKKVEEKEKKHYIDYVLNILESEGLKVEDRMTEIYIKETKTQYDNIFMGRENIVGLNLTAVGELARNWPKEYALELIQKLLEENYKVVLFGTRNDLEYGSYIENRIKKNNFINLTGKTDLVEFVNLIRKCDIYISVDTGGIHIANALGIKTIGLYVPGSNFSWGIRGNNTKIISYKTNCAPCNQHKMKYCKDNKCMKQITVNEVYEKIKEINFVKIN